MNTIILLTRKITLLMRNYNGWRGINHDSERAWLEYGQWGVNLFAEGANDQRRSEHDPRRSEHDKKRSEHGKRKSEHGPRRSERS
jgi:hypothetical protein